jgi:putative transposase
MPDHLHLFCAPVRPGFSIEQWITYWKRCFRRLHGPSGGTFQSRGWHHRLRSAESYAEKWNYVRQNPVRAGLIENTEKWPWQGTMHDLLWRE